MKIVFLWSLTWSQNDEPSKDAAFIAVKDQKASFPGLMECRLINSAKNHLGKISKGILYKMSMSNTVRIKQLITTSGKILVQL